MNGTRIGGTAALLLTSSQLQGTEMAAAFVKALPAISDLSPKTRFHSLAGFREVGKPRSCEFSASYWSRVSRCDECAMARPGPKILPTVIKRFGSISAPGVHPSAWAHPALHLIFRVEELGNIWGAWNRIFVVAIVKLWQRNAISLFDRFQSIYHTDQYTRRP